MTSRSVFPPFGPTPIAVCGRLGSRKIDQRLYSERGIPALRRLGVASFRVFQWIDEFEGENYCSQAITLPERRCPQVKRSYMWSRFYINAILETDSGKLPLRIREAEWAIQQRLSSSLLIDATEQELISGARAKLKSLKTERIAKTA